MSDFSCLVLAKFTNLFKHQKAKSIIFKIPSKDIKRINLFKKKFEEAVSRGENIYIPIKEKPFILIHHRSISKLKRLKGG